MSAIRNYLNKIKPNFEEGGKLHAFRSVFDGFETFALVPNDTSKTGVNIHDAIDSKRIMSMVVIALMPAMLFGMYNVGYQNYLAAGTLAQASFFEMFCYGFLAVLPKILVSYIVGLGIEFAWAQWKGEEIQEGYLVSGIIIPLIIPIGCPLWMLALACAFSVIFCKEIFGGTGMNIFNPAIAARMFLFFAYPSKMTGDQVWVAQDTIFGLGNTLPDGFTAATPLGQVAQGVTPDMSVLDMAIGLIPGSIGETSVFAIAIGACILLVTGIASWRTMLFVFCGGALMSFIFQGNHVAAVSSRTPGDGWFCLRCRVHGHRPCDIVPHAYRTIHLWLHHRCDGHHHPCDECGLSRGYDARHLLRQHDCSHHRPLCGGAQY